MGPIRLGMITLACATAVVSGRAAAAEAQKDIPWVQPMPRLPDPLHLVDWKRTALDYYRLVCDPQASGAGLPAVSTSEDGARFGFPAYLSQVRDRTVDSGEAITCVAGVIGAQLTGLDPRYRNVDWVQSCRRWFDPTDGVYKNRIGQRGGHVSHVIYGYWPLALGIMLGSVNRDAPNFRADLDRQFAFVLQMARDMGCPGQPELEQGYDIAARKVIPIGIDWNPGNASCLAWMLYAGYQWTGNPEYLECAKAALAWQFRHPGRYEISHVMGPLVVARINAEQGGELDLDWMMNNWFGDYTRLPGFVHHWAITHQTKVGGLGCDGLDGAWWRRPDNNGFYAFAMGSYQAVAWLLPTARYDQRYARSIARYALNAANSCRFFLGIDLDWNHQDHSDWRRSLPEQNRYLLSYEGVRTEAHWTDDSHRYQPYATGDPLALFSRRYGETNRAEYWADKTTFSKTSENISLYMGHHIGFLGAVYNPTEAPAIIAWDLTKTDYFRPPCYPTFLLYNPYPDERTIRFELTQSPCDLYDAVHGEFVARAQQGKAVITLPPNEAKVLVLTPPGGKVTQNGAKLLVNNVVVDYRKND